MYVCMQEHDLQATSKTFSLDKAPRSKNYSIMHPKLLLFDTDHRSYMKVYKKGAISSRFGLFFILFGF